VNNYPPYKRLDEDTKSRGLKWINEIRKNKKTTTNNEENN
jgi:hypothetical protein